MEAKGLQNDPRYNQLVYLRSKHTANSEAQVCFLNLLVKKFLTSYFYFQIAECLEKHIFTTFQRQQLQMQIMAYRLLARNQPLSQQITSGIQSNKN